MRRTTLIAAYFLVPVLAMTAAFVLLGNQIIDAVTLSVHNDKAAAAALKAETVVIGVRRANFTLMRYSADPNERWLLPLRDVKQQIPDLLKELDEVCTSSKSRAAGKRFSESLGTIIAMDDETVWLADLAPGDMAPIRSRQLRAAIQQGWHSLSADEIALSEILADERIQPYNYSALLPIWLAFAVELTALVACSIALGRGTLSEAKVLHAQFRTELRKHADARRVRNAESERIEHERDAREKLDEQEVALLDTIEAPLLVMQPDGKILRSNSHARAFLEKLGNPEFLFTEQLKQAGMDINVESKTLSSGVLLCKISS